MPESDALFDTNRHQKLRVQFGAAPNAIRAIATERSTIVRLIAARYWIFAIPSGTANSSHQIHTSL